MRGTKRHGHLFVSLKIDTLAQCLTEKAFRFLCNVEFVPEERYEAENYALQFSVLRHSQLATAMALDT